MTDSMPHLNYESRELTFKLVYYGPGMSGKTTNLAYIHRSLMPDVRGNMVMLNTSEERTLFFDFFPIELGRIEGFALRFNMYTVPGQTCYEASRRLILDGADGVVFVADSQQERLAENVASFEMMQSNLHSYDIDLRHFPIVLQYNKRDCAVALPIGTLERMMGLEGVPVLEAIALSGQGVLETVREATRRIIQAFQPEAV